MGDRLRGMRRWHLEGDVITSHAKVNQKDLRVAIMVNKRVWNAVLGGSLKNDRMISVHLQGKPFNITVIQVYAPTSNAEETEVEWFYEDLRDLLELTPKKRCPFHYRGWESKMGSQETPGVTGKFGLGVQNEAGQRLIEFCQKNALVIANTLFQQHKRRLMDITSWSTPKSDWSYSSQLKMEKLYTVSKNKTRSWLWLRSGTPYRLKLKKTGKTARPFR